VLVKQASWMFAILHHLNDKIASWSSQLYRFNLIRVKSQHPNKNPFKLIKVNVGLSWMNWKAVPQFQAHSCCNKSVSVAVVRSSKLLGCWSVSVELFAIRAQEHINGIIKTEMLYTVTMRKRSHCQDCSMFIVGLHPCKRCSWTELLSLSDCDWTGL